MLIHLGDDLINDAAAGIRNSLNEHGRLMISIPVERPSLDEDGMAPEGRVFVMRHADFYTKLFEQNGFMLLSYCLKDDAMGRSDVK